jgi:hypothetical protein
MQSLPTLFDTTFGDEMRGISLSSGDSSRNLGELAFWVVAKVENSLEDVFFLEYVDQKNQRVL